MKKDPNNVRLAYHKLSIYVRTSFLKVGDNIWLSQPNEPVLVLKLISTPYKQSLWW